MIAFPRSQVTNQVNARIPHVLSIRAQVAAVEPSLRDESKTNGSAWGYAMVSARGLGLSNQIAECADEGAQAAEEGSPLEHGYVCTL